MKKKPTKYFLLQEKQKQKKQITISEDELGKSLTTNSTILKECTNYFQKIYTKQKTCATTQNILLKHTSHKTTNEQNHKLTTKKKKKKNRSQEMTTSFIRFTHFRIKYELPTKGKKV